MDDIKNQIDFDNDKNDTSSDLSQSVWDLIENDEREQLPVADKGLRKCPPTEDSTKPLEFVPIPGVPSRVEHELPPSGDPHPLLKVQHAVAEFLRAKPGVAETVLERLFDKSSSMKELLEIAHKSGAAEALERISDKSSSMNELLKVARKPGAAEALERISDKVLGSNDVIKVLKDFAAGDNRSLERTVKPEQSGPGTPSGDSPIIDTPRRPRGR